MSNSGSIRDLICSLSDQLAAAVMSTMALPTTNIVTFLVHSANIKLGSPLVAWLSIFMENHKCGICSSDLTEKWRYTKKEKAKNPNTRQDSNPQHVDHKLCFLPLCYNRCPVILAWKCDQAGENTMQWKIALLRLSLNTYKIFCGKIVIKKLKTNHYCKKIFQIFLLWWIYFGTFFALEGWTEYCCLAKRNY